MQKKNGSQHQAGRWEILRQTLRFALRSDPDTDIQYLYNDNNTTVEKLDNSAAASALISTNSIILSTNELTQSQRIQNTNAENLAFTYLNNTFNGTAINITANNTININNSIFVKNKTSRSGGAIYNAQ